MKQERYLGEMLKYVRSMKIGKAKAMSMESFDGIPRFSMMKAVVLTSSN